ncbi:MAG: hypothetical protein HC932_03785, partial [Thermales bacterium]|nr:hypothetical protein [Thermales bacterium]
KKKSQPVEELEETALIENIPAEPSLSSEISMEEVEGSQEEEQTGVIKIRPLKFSQFKKEIITENITKNSPLPNCLIGHTTYRLNEGDETFQDNWLMEISNRNLNFIERYSKSTNEILDIFDSNFNDSVIDNISVQSIFDYASVQCAATGVGNIPLKETDFDFKLVEYEGTDSAIMIYDSVNFSKVFILARQGDNYIKLSKDSASNFGTPDQVAERLLELFQLQ